MNMLPNKHFFVGFIVSEIPRVSVFGYYPYSVTFPYIAKRHIYLYYLIKLKVITFKLKLLALNHTGCGSVLL